MTLWKRLAATLLAATLTLTVPACQSDDTSGTDDAATPDSQQNPPDDGGEEAPGEGLNLDIWYALSSVAGELFVEQAEAFDAARDDVTLNLSYSGNSGETATKVSAALMSDTAPDAAVVFAGPLFTGGRGNHAMAELVKDEDFDKDDIFDGMWEYTIFMDGDISAVPYGISTPIMYYNKDVMNEVGIDLHEQPPRSWDDFLALNKEILESDAVKAKSDFTGFDVADPAWLFKTMLKQQGNDVVTYDGEKVEPIFQDDKGVAVAEYWQTLVHDGIMLKGQHDNAENRFLAGNSAFIVASSNRIMRWEGATEFEVGAIEMPSFSDEPSVALGGNVLVIFTQDEARQQASWDLIKHLTTTENNLKFALGTGYLPIRQSAVASNEAQKMIKENELYKVAFEQLDDTWSYFHFEQMGTMDMELNGALDKIENNTGSIPDILNETAEILNEEIEAG